MPSGFAPWIEAGLCLAWSDPSKLSRFTVCFLPDGHPSWVRLCSRSQAMVRASYSSLLKLVRAWTAKDKVAVVQI